MEGMRRIKNPVKIKGGDTIALINPANSQMYSLRSGGVEVMWNGGAPENAPTKGWPNSEIVMFPIVGPAENDRITVNGKQYKMFQHGISRDLPWSVVSKRQNSVTMVQAYEAGKEVSGRKGTSVFPVSFRLTKTYSITRDGSLSFSLTVENTGKEPLSYALGWHPAFIADKDGAIEVRSWSKYQGGASLEQIKEAEGNVRVFEESNRVIYSSRGFLIEFTHTFGASQIWHKDDDLVAIEPITAVKLEAPIEGVDIELSKQPGYRSLMRGRSETFEARIKVVPKDPGSEGQD